MSESASTSQSSTNVENVVTYFIIDNLNRMAINRYLECYFVPGQLENRFLKSGRDERYSWENCAFEFRSTPIDFVANYPNLTINDFIFMRGLDITSDVIKTILMLLRYGCDCSIYLDRAVLQWILWGSDKTKKAPRQLAKFEQYAISQAKNSDRGIVKEYKNIKEVDPKLNVNSAFNQFIRNNVSKCNASGILIDIEFFVSKLINKANTRHSESLFKAIVNFCKANNDLSNYLMECSRYNKCKFSACFNTIKNIQENGGNLLTDNNNNTDDTQQSNVVVKLNSIYRDYCPSSIVSDFEMIQNEALDSVLGRESILNDEDDFIPHTPDTMNIDNYVPDSTVCTQQKTKNKSKTKKNVTAISSNSISNVDDDDADDDKNFEFDDNEDTFLSRNFKYSSANNAADNEYDDLNEKKLSSSVLFFSMTRKIKKSKNYMKNVQRVLTKSCFCADTNVRYCILLYYNLEDKFYRLMTRQVKTAKGVLSQQKDLLVCGWSGMCENITKNTVLKMLKTVNSSYKVKRTQLYKITNVDDLINDITTVVCNIENVRITKSPMTLSPTSSVCSMPSTPYLLPESLANDEIPTTAAIVSNLSQHQSSNETIIAVNTITEGGTVHSYNHLDPIDYIDTHQMNNDFDKMVQNKQHNQEIKYHSQTELATVDAPDFGLLMNSDPADVNDFCNSGGAASGILLNESQKTSIYLCNRENLNTPPPSQMLSSTNNCNTNDNDNDIDMQSDGSLGEVFKSIVSSDLY